MNNGLQKHLEELTTEQRQEIRQKLQKRRTRTTADRRGKAAFLYLLDEADKAQTVNSNDD